MAKTKINILKRNGALVPFRKSKIKNAIFKAKDACKDSKSTEDQLNEIIDKVCEDCYDGIKVEDIQDNIVQKLERIDPVLSRCYATYRSQQEALRMKNIPKFTKAIKEIVEEKDSDTTRENSNRVTNEIATKMQLIGEEANKYMFLSDPDMKEAVDLHSKGVLHVHDTSYWALPATNCSLLNIYDMLWNGTVINDVKIIRPHSLRVATTVATQIMNKVRKLQYGGMTISIAHLAPWVRIDKENIEKDGKKYGLSGGDLDWYIQEHLNENIRAAIQTLNYQILTLSDDIFVSISMDIHELPEYEEETVMLIREILKQRIKGMPNKQGQPVTQTFPKLLFITYEELFNKTDKHRDLMDLAVECVSRRMAPDFISAKKSKEYKEGNVVPCMGCRSFLQPWKDENGKYKFWGRGNLGVVSLNLPYIALETKYETTKPDSSNIITRFYQHLEEYFWKVISIHKHRIDYIANSKVDVAPLLWMYGAFSRAESGTLIKDIIKDGYFTASVGYVGLAETIYALGVDYMSEKGRTLGLDILKYLNCLCGQAREKSELGIYYSMYGTPMESYVGTATRALKSFPLTENVNDRAYITNSYHVPVHYQINAFDKIDFEAPFQKYSTGGTISYIEASDLRKNPEATEQLIHYMYDKMMYCEINIRSADVCHVCGYEGEILYDSEKRVWYCPQCGNTDHNKMTRVRRTCGYLSRNNWNQSRTSEITHRVLHI